MMNVLNVITKLMVCCQSFECEDCDNKSNVEDDLNIHEETMHGVIDSNDCLGWTHEDYYDFYGFNEYCHEKLTPPSFTQSLY